MTSKELQNIQPGARIRFSQDKNKLASCLGSQYAGRKATVVRNDVGNERVYFSMTREEARSAGIPDYDWTALERGEWYAYYQCIESVIKKRKTTKPTKFSKKDVEAYSLLGSNDRLKSELTIRVQQARRELETAVKPETFNTQTKKMAEQLRQARLIHRGIKL